MKSLQGNDINNIESATPLLNFPLPHNFSQFNYYPEILYDTNSYYSLSSVMPPKSDGSLCIMEPINMSQPEIGIVNPTMGAHIYHTRGMALSIDSMYYNQNQDHYLQESSEAFLMVESYEDVHTLSLSKSTPSQSSSVTVNIKKKGPAKKIVHRKTIETFGQRTSQYRGVTRHRWTGRYEAHLWDNSCKREGQTRKGKQVYLGGYDTEEKASRSYDLAALKYWGPSTYTNFPLENYQQELEEMKNMTRQEYVAHLRRRSSGFSRGASIYRGVTRHHQHGRWQARIGRVAGNKDLYLGTFTTQEEAAEAYDIAAIKFRGLNAVTNFVNSTYDVEKIMASNTLLTGEFAKRNKEEEANALKMDNWNTELLHHQKSSGVEDLNSLCFPISSFSKEELVVNHVSNASSREEGPDKIHVASVNSWIQSAQLRPQIPFFAAWTDASL